MSAESRRVEAISPFVKRRYENRVGITTEYVQGVVANGRAIRMSLEDGLGRVPVTTVRGNSLLGGKID